MKKALVLMNLGGPNDLSEVFPFLVSLFSEPLILRLPNPFRWILARLIAWRRLKTATAIYRKMGGKSPLLSETQAQREALQEMLGPEWEVFIAMRYAAPKTDAAFEAVKAARPEVVVLCPLYPQYSTTTTLSSVRAWQDLERSQGVLWRTVVLPSYPTLDGLVQYFASAIGDDLKGARVLFSAHGLPQKIVDQGDPYPHEVKATVTAVVEKLPAGVDWVVCYQSRVGPLAWLEPSTEEEIKRAGRDKKAIVMVPIAFVSEHSETLVELDEEYRDLALQEGVSSYRRIMTPRTDKGFLSSLQALIEEKAS